MVEFEIARIVKGSVAALALWAMLGQQEIVHLRTAHLDAFRLLHALLDPQERCSGFAVVRAVWRLRFVVNLAEQAGFLLQPRHDDLMRFVPDVDSDPLAL